MAFFIFRQFGADLTRHQPHNLRIYAGLALERMDYLYFHATLD